MDERVVRRPAWCTRHQVVEEQLYLFRVPACVSLTGLGGGGGGGEQCLGPDANMAQLRLLAASAHQRPKYAWLTEWKYRRVSRSSTPRRSVKGSLSTLTCPEPASHCSTQRQGAWRSKPRQQGAGRAPALHRKQTIQYSLASANELRPVGPNVLYQPVRPRCTLRPQTSGTPPAAPALSCASRMPCGFRLAATA